MPQEQPQRQIFRQHAIHQYLQSNSKDILPKTISSFTFTVCWIMLLLTILVGLLVWFIPIPYYAYAPGIVLNQQSSHPTQSAQVLIFFPENALPLLHQNQPVKISMGTNGPQISGHLDHITSQPLSPTEIGQRYALSANQVLKLPPSTIVGTVRLDQQGLVQRYARSSVNVQYQQGTQRVLSLLLQ
jgi:hypothetical protein